MYILDLVNIPDWILVIVCLVGIICTLYTGNNPSLIICDPEIIKHITVKDFENFTNRATHNDFLQLMVNANFETDYPVNPPRSKRENTYI
ncbi:hypothetical protein MAR_022993 [Mya arenaria]|uniref:Uncharacterized protein n=1 Tax=Mya arenaria TaxID=6604 RepID=A0ABY7DQL7_MYAAR|nr:hypothetical protein MAR_022993 [Mya arenaria]